MDANNIEQIVKQVLDSMRGASGACIGRRQPQLRQRRAFPRPAAWPMLTKLENFDIQEYAIPEIGDDDILVKVEGCGVCGTDAHEFKRDPFGLIPLVLGHEGTGEIVKWAKTSRRTAPASRSQLAIKWLPA